MRYPLEIRLQPSKRLEFLNAAIHVTAAFAFLRSSLPVWIVVPAVAFLFVSLRSAIRDERGKAGFVLVLEPDAELRISEPGRHGRAIHASPETSSTDFGWAVWLHWRGTPVRGSRRRPLRGAVMLVRSNMTDEAWRGLKIWLRHKVAAAAETDDVQLRAPKQKVQSARLQPLDVRSGGAASELSDVPSEASPENRGKSAGHGSPCAEVRSAR